jgi:3-hydroxyacyl-[acyl-carrier-protein] dehydratase
MVTSDWVNASRSRLRMLSAPSARFRRDRHVAGIGREIVDEHRSPLGHRRADDALPEAQAHALGGALRIAHRVRDPQLLPLRVGEIDGKGVEAHEAGEEDRNAGQQLAEVEHRGHLAAQVEERLELFAFRRSQGHTGGGARRRGGAGGRFTRDPRLYWFSRWTFDCRWTTPRSSASSRIAIRSSSWTASPRSRQTGASSASRMSHNERYLAHRAGRRPVLPPSVLTEAVAQVGAILILAKPENREKLIYFMGIDRVRYRRPVCSGDVVEIEATVRRLRSRMGVLHGVARVGGQVAAEGTMTFALGARTDLAGLTGGAAPA